MQKNINRIILDPEEKKNLISWKIEDMIKDMEDSKISLPIMQREFVWNNTQIKTLFDSLLRKYPIGVLILWRCDIEELNRDKIKSFAGVLNDIKKTVHLVIDGQQRLMSIKMILGSTTYKALHYDLMWKQEGGSHYKSPFNWNKKKKLPIHFILNKSEGEIIREAKKRYVDFDSEIVKKNISRVRELKQYKLPIMELFHTKAEEAQNIFFLINNQGSKINANQLILSKFRLFDTEISKWIDKFVEENKKNIFWKIKSHQLVRIISWFCFNKDPLETFKALSKNINLRKEFTEKKEYLFISKNWKDFNKILESLKLPIQQQKGTYAYIHTYIIYLKLKKINKSLSISSVKNVLCRWILFSYISGRYSGNRSKTTFKEDQDSFLNENINQVRHFIVKIKEKINRIFGNSFWNELHFEVKTKKKTHPLFKVYIASLIYFQVCYLYSNEIITIDNIINKKDKWNCHHFYPKKFLENIGYKNIDSMANLTIITKKYNKEIDCLAPIDYHKKYIKEWFKGLDVLKKPKEREIKFHSLYNVALNATNINEYKKYLDKRSKDMLKIIKKFVDSFK